MNFNRFMVSVGPRSCCSLRRHKVQFTTSLRLMQPGAWQARPREPVCESLSARARPREPVRESLSARACPVVSLGGSEFQSIHGLGGPSVVLQFTTSQSAVYDQFTTNAAWGLASPSARACLREPVRESPSTRACPREPVRESRSATME